MKTIALIFAFFLLVSCAAQVMGAGPFATPEALMKTYHESSDQNLLSKCFARPNRYKRSENFWLSYKIIEKKRTSSELKKRLKDSLDESVSFEITVETVMNDPKKNNPILNFWYLVQKRGSDWKIIEHSDIPNENYPALD